MVPSSFPAAQTESPAVVGLGKSIIRTVVPAVVGLVVTQLARVGVNLGDDPSTVAALSSAATIIVGSLYYAGVRLAETRIGPAWGWLIGYADAPAYVKRGEVIDTTGTESA